jgi:hypothetical protein
MIDGSADTAPILVVHIAVVGLERRQAGLRSRTVTYDLRRSRWASGRDRTCQETVTRLGYRRVKDHLIRRQSAREHEIARIRKATPNLALTRSRAARERASVNRIARGVEEPVRTDVVTAGARQRRNHRDRLAATVTTTCAAAAVVGAMSAVLRITVGAQACGATQSLGATVHAATIGRAGGSTAGRGGTDLAGAAAMLGVRRPIAGIRAAKVVPGIALDLTSVVGANAMSGH